MEHQPNALINASSPYLLQHAYNPVAWQEWSEGALEQARAENKLILVSIGYSACHWCHVMEHESFEDFEVAEVMNKHFICIKIDREERPDIDHIYMLAVQLMGLNGGWPLNCICLPDQRPIYGGTYFKKQDWINILESVADFWQNEPEKAIDYASKLTKGITEAERIFPVAQTQVYTKDTLTEILTPWKRTFDMVYGGYTRAPKFPLPNNWQFLLRAGYFMEDEALITATMYTLEKMAMGGIYDQIGGGFARYSVDSEWHVPHFEKMLYDNAQLMRLYTEAFQFSKNDAFKAVVEDIYGWLQREMTSTEGLFFSALDADSEGVEGKFYVWDKEIFDAVLGPDADLAGAYFNVTAAGNWEEEQTNILLRKLDDEHFAQQTNTDLETLQQKVVEIKQRLLQKRAGRQRPGLDNKCLTSWNGLMITALAEAAYVFNIEAYYLSAKKAAFFILSHLRHSDNALYRNYNNSTATIEAFLDDYALLIESMIALYQYDFDQRWLDEARLLAEHVLENFEDSESPMLFYTSAGANSLIARKYEVMDNVMPSANSVMAQNLRTLGLLYDEKRYTDKAAAMLAAVVQQIKKYGSAYSNWASLLLDEVQGMTEIVLTGAVDTFKDGFRAHYMPNKIFLGGTNSSLPLLENKSRSESKIYICRNKTCSLPVATVEEALTIIN